MSLATRITLTAFRLLAPRSQCQQLFRNNNVFSPDFTRTFFKRPKLSRSTEALPGNNVKDWMTSALPMRYVYVNTGQRRWEDIPEGFFFDTGYADSHPESPFNPKIPIVLAVHDLYGGHEPLLPLLAPLVLKNYRVIAINLPSSKHTNGLGFGHDDGFLHSTDENAEFIGDFLEELKIPKVDLILGYGTGCYPLLRVCNKTDLCQSAVLVCPAGHIPYKGIQPHRLYELFVELWEIPFLRPYMKVIAFLLKHLKGLNKFTTDEIIEGFKIIRGIDFNSIGSYLFYLKVKAFPLGVIYCQKDPLIESDTLKHFCSLLGLEESHMTFYNKQGEITQKATVNKCQGIVVEERPDNILKDFHLPIINMIEKLVKLVHQQK